VFYADVLGLTVSAERYGDFVQLWAGGIDLCIDGAATHSECVPIFTVDNFEALRRALLAASVHFEGPLEGSERRYVVVTDPDDHVVVIEEEPHPAS
jgi:hypothetical protein